MEVGLPTRNTCSEDAFHFQNDARFRLGLVGEGQSSRQDPRIQRWVGWGWGGGSGAFQAYKILIVCVGFFFFIEFRCSNRSYNSERSGRDFANNNDRGVSEGLSAPLVRDLNEE